ncbi:MAG: 4-alpha-glucanotransferase [Lewinellaceae bacterium]|nr:4-alpha-glucanotransferase [Lewinellaceae bacterium]
MRVFQFYIHYKTNIGQQLAISFQADQNPVETVMMQSFDAEHWFLFRSSNEGFKTLKYKYLTTLHGNSSEVEWGDWRIIEADHYHHGIFNDSWRNRDEISNVFLSDAFSKAIFKRNSIEDKALTTNAMYCLRFQLNDGMVPTQYRVGIIGNTSFLGQWEKPRLLSDELFPQWSVDFGLSAKDLFIEYKYVIVDPTNDAIVAWEKGDNRKLEVHFSDENNQIFIQTDNTFYTDEKWKGTGIAIPVFSLRSATGLGIGEFHDLNDIVDWVHSMEMDVIQVLPINDTIANKTWKDSYPYAAISVFALHPLYIHLPDIAKFKDQKTQKSYDGAIKKLNKLEAIDFEQVLKEKFKFLRILFEQEYDNFTQDEAAKKFLNENQQWLKSYAVFCHLRDEFNTCNFNVWPKYSTFSNEILEILCAPEYAKFKDIEFYYFIQYHADKQLRKVKSYARSKGVALKGDLPIGIYRYSCDAWVAPGMYNMDEQAGAPPDDYAVLGQNWGFPTYNWQVMSQDGFKWWRNRMKALNKYFDALRIDHILGFFRIWQIPMDQVYGTLGLFNPRLPLTKEEMAKYGIYGNYERYTKPFIRQEILEKLFGDDAESIYKTFLDENNGTITFKPKFKNQKDVSDFVKKNQEHYTHLEGLLLLMSDVLLIEEPNSGGNLFNPRITLDTTHSYQYLSDVQKKGFDAMYRDYYFKRHDAYWKEQAIWKLPALLDASNMLICGEDLGMIPDSVPGVMKQLNIMSLEIQRMPKGQSEFGQVNQYPYFSVSSPSCHDMSTIRGWWEEDHSLAKRFYYSYIHGTGFAPLACSTDIVDFVVRDHLNGPSMLVIFPIQDILGLDEHIRKSDAASEQINIPADVNHYWRFRLHVDTKTLLNASDLNQHIKSMIQSSGR